MYRFFDMGLEAGVAAVILVPLFLVVNRIYFHDLGRTVGYLIFAIYLAGVDAVVGLPCITYIRLRSAGLLSSPFLEKIQRLRVYASVRFLHLPAH